MATTLPTPRSRSQILGDLIDDLISRLGLTDLKPGSPVLSLLESVSASDVRTTQDLFQLLATTLDNATGQALDRFGADLRTPRFGATASTGFTTWTDKSFARIFSRVYSGTAAPIVGSDKIYLEDASTFPASGEIYLGRGTERFEGPLTYTSKVSLGSYWRLDLAVGDETRSIHLQGEDVVLAQGGVRVIPVGTIANAALGGAQAAVGFSTIFEARIPDGETQVEKVLVVSQRPGSSGRVGAGAIKILPSLPFTGAAVVNPLPLSNGTDTEPDDTYRERLRQVIQNRARGTSQAIEAGVLGVTSEGEQRRVSSARLLEQSGRATLFIDDGTGYEEWSEGIAFEVLQESAIGGEQFFQVTADLPVTQALLETTLSSPFVLESACTLSVLVGGTLSQHSFSAVDFREINSASAWEVVASINSNPELLFSARTIDSGRRVAIFSKSPTNDDLILFEDLSKVDANQWLGFASTRAETLRLFKNDILLSKDGERAEIFSAPQSQWLPVSGTQTLTISVDGTPAQSISIDSSDFVAEGTGYLSLASNNSLEAWATVLTAKIAGIQVETNGGRLTLISNRGRSSRASLTISGGTLVSGGQFFTSDEGLSNTGRTNDYQFNRSTGQIKLSSPLLPGDRLTIGTDAPRAFLQSSALGTVTLSSDAELWFVIDGQPAAVRTTLLPSQTISIASYTPAPPVTWGVRVRVTASSGTPFSNVQVGDWAIFMDTNLLAANQGAWRVAEVISGGLSFDIERASFSSAQAGVSMSGGGITFVRTSALVRKITVPAGTGYTAATLAESMDADLVGATASVWGTNKIRVSTIDSKATGGVALVAQNASAAALGLPSKIVSNGETLAASVSGSLFEGRTTPSRMVTVTAVAGQDLDLSTTADLRSTFSWMRETPDVDGLGSRSRFGTNRGLTSSIESFFGATHTFRSNFLQVPTLNSTLAETAPISLNGQDQLTIMVDGQYRFAFDFFRRLRPTTSTYGTVNDFTDADNSNLSLAAAFGTGFDFRDFTALMHARAKSHAEAGDTTKTILWRAKTWGAVGEFLKVRYVYPTLAAQPVSVSTDPQVSTDDLSHVKVALSSGTARSGHLIRPTTKVGTIAITAAPLVDLVYLLGFSVSTASRTSNVTTVTLNIAAPGVTDHNLQLGDRIWIQSGNVNFSSGVKIVTVRTASTVSYVETAADIGATASIGTLSFDTAGEATFSGTTVVGDIASWAGPFSNTAFRQALRIQAIGTQFLRVRSEIAASLTTVPTWTILADTSLFSAFPLNAANNVASAIVTIVNGDGNSPVTATGVGLAGVATGVISQASFEEFSTVNKGYTLTDGSAAIRSTSTPPSTSVNFTFTFKSAPTVALATNSDWANEDVRLVPSTVQNAVDFLSCLGVTALSTLANVDLDADGNLTLSSKTIGSGSALQVQGGGANATSTSIISGAVDLSSVTTVGIDKAAGEVLSGGWVRLQNVTSLPRQVFQPATELVFLASDGSIELGVTPAWVDATALGVQTGFSWQIERFGSMVVYRWSGLGVSPSVTGLSVGDYVWVHSGTASTGNRGLFRIVGVDTARPAFWIENSLAVEEVSSPDILFLDPLQSILPGDRLTVGTTAWGTQLVGTWTVTAINPSNPARFSIDGSFTTFSGSLSLGGLSSLVQIHEGQPSSLVAKLVGISPDSTNARSIVKLALTGCSYWIGPTAGTLLQNLDKLDFPTGLAAGTDAYRHSLGLIAEVAKIVYGRRDSPSSFPGLAAANSIVDISGPTVKRLSLSFALRVRSQFSTNEVAESFRSAIAAEVNRSPIGKALSISTLVASGQRVAGVEAVAVISPTYGLGSDQIPVQPSEKLLVLDLEDISITLVGN